MGQFVKENAHLRTDVKKYAENYDRIFKKPKCDCELFEDRVCNLCIETITDEDLAKIAGIKDFNGCDS